MCRLCKAMNAHSNECALHSARAVSVSAGSCFVSESARMTRHACHHRRHWVRRGRGRGAARAGTGLAVAHRTWRVSQDEPPDARLVELQHRVVRDVHLPRHPHRVKSDQVKSDQVKSDQVTHTHIRIRMTVTPAQSYTSARTTPPSSHRRHAQACARTHRHARLLQVAAEHHRRSVVGEQPIVLQLLPTTM
jgi:hypothetical protein